MSMKDSVKLFFDNLEIYQNDGDIDHKDNLYKSISNFLESRSTRTATDVYEAFFSAYWIGIQGEENPFLELIRKMKSFEENAGKLLDKHRDHYIHSVYVFLLGLSIFAGNSKFREAFKTTILTGSYPDAYDTRNEEFFYRWGLASLFHDIAYPLEITLRQANKYISFIYDYSLGKQCKDAVIKMEIPCFEDLIHLPKLKPAPKYELDFNKRYPKLTQFESSVDILAERLSISFHLDFERMRKHLSEFFVTMRDEGFIDHGYYSALIMLKWYYSLIYKTNWNPAYFYAPVVDSSSAILLHNYYKHVLKKPPFNINAMNPISHPIAYLLILCDELQDWSRTGFGEKDDDNLAPVDFNLSVSEDKLAINYQFIDGKEHSTFISKKLDTIHSLLDINEILNEGLLLTFIIV